MTLHLAILSTRAGQPFSVQQLWAIEGLSGQCRANARKAFLYVHEIWKCRVLSDIAAAAVQVGYYGNFRLESN